MKTLLEFLKTTNVEINSSGIYELMNEEQIARFLEEKGFSYRVNHGLTDIFDKFKRSNTPIYFMGEYKQDNGNDWWVRFGNGGKLTVQNPMFFWRTKSMEGASNYQVSNYPGRGVYTFKSFKEFKEYVINFFNW